MTKIKLSGSNRQGFDLPIIWRASGATGPYGEASPVPAGGWSPAGRSALILTSR